MTTDASTTHRAMRPHRQEPFSLLLNEMRRTLTITKVNHKLILLNPLVTNSPTAACAALLEFRHLNVGHSHFVMLRTFLEILNSNVPDTIIKILRGPQTSHMTPSLQHRQRSDLPIGITAWLIVAEPITMG